jgi:hypothetical protein
MGINKKVTSTKKKFLRARFITNTNRINEFTNEQELKVETKKSHKGSLIFNDTFIYSEAA